MELIFRAVRNNDLETIKEILVQRPFDLNLRDNKQNTPLILACKRNHRDIAKYLVDLGADLNGQNVYGISALTYADRNQDAEMYLYMIIKGALEQALNWNFHDDLREACEKGGDELLSLMLKTGTGFNTFDHYISHKQGYSLFANVCTYRVKELARQIFKMTNVDFETGNVKRYFVWNPLMIACRFGYLKTVKWLFCNGVDLSVQDIYGEGPLCKALFYEHKEISDLLRKRIVRHVYEKLVSNSPIKIKELITESIDDPKTFIFNSDCVKAFLSMDMFNVSSMNEYVVNFYFTTNLFKENYIQNIFGVLDEFTNVLETTRKKLCEFYCDFEPVDETSTSYLIHNEFSFKEFIQLLDDANLAVYLNKHCNENLKFNKVSVLFKCINILEKSFE